MTSGNRVFGGRGWVSTILSIVLALIFLAIAFRGIEWGSFTALLKSVSVPWLFVFAVSIIFSHWLRAYRWKIFLSEIKDVSTHHAFAALIIGYGVNNVFPRLGEVSRAVFLGQYENISRMSMLGSIVLERMIDLFFFGLSVLLAGVVFSGNLYEEFPWLRMTFIVGLILFLLLIFFLILLSKKRDLLETLLTRLPQRISRGFSGKMRELVDKLMQGFSGLRNTKSLWKAIAVSILIMLNYGLSSYLALLMFAIPGDFSMAWVIMSVSAIGIMIPTPGGIGSYHTITKAIMTGLYGLSASVGIAYALVSHGVSYLLHSLLGVLYFLLFRKRYGTPRDMHLFPNNGDES